MAAPSGNIEFPQGQLDNDNDSNRLVTDTESKGQEDDLLEFTMEEKLNNLDQLIIEGNVPKLISYLIEHQSSLKEDGRNPEITKTMIRLANKVPTMEWFLSEEGYIPKRCENYTGILPVMSKLMGATKYTEMIYKVIFCLLLITISVNCQLTNDISVKNTIENTKVTQTNNQLIVESIVKNVQISEMTETVSIAPLTQFILKIEQVMKMTLKFKEFSYANKYCSQVSGSHIDNIEEIRDIAQRKNLNSIVMSHVEPENPKNFLVALIAKGVDKYICKYSYTLNAIQKMSALNTLRHSPYYT